MTSAPRPARAFPLAALAPLVPLAAIAVLVFVHGLSFHQAPQDDSFISFRYARNLVDGNGLVFNAGERVEGYSNFLWTVLMAPVLALGIDPVEGSRFLGLAFVVATLVVFHRMTLASSGSREGGGWKAAGAGLLLASSGSFIAEAIGGLETTLFAFLVTSLLLVVEREEEQGSDVSSSLTAGGARAGLPAGVLAGILGGLAAITRPEGILVLLGTAVHRCLPEPLGGARRRSARGASQASPYGAAARSAAIGLAFMLPHRLWAWSYYGQPFPNTFYAKVGGNWDSVVRGAGYAGEFAMAWLPVLALAFIGIFAVSARRRSLRGAYVLGYIAYVIGVGGDYKGTLRFFAPVMPIVALLAAEGIALLARQLDGRAARRVLSVSIAGAAALGLLWLSAPARDFSKVREWKYETDRIAGRWFQRNAPAGSVLATSNAGIIPYYAGLPTIDMLGLTDEHISHVVMPHMGRGVAGHEKADGAYVLSRRPDIVLFMQTRVTTKGPVSLEDAGRLMNFVAEAQLYQDPQFQKDYVWVSEPVSGYTLNFFKRRELVLAPDGK